jgi:adenylate cyclase
LLKYFITAAFFFFCGHLLSAEEKLKDTVRINEILKQSFQLQNTSQDSSYDLAVKAGRLSQEINFGKGLAGAYIRIGSILYSRGQNDTALWYLHQAHTIRKSLGDYNGASGACIMMSQVYNTLGKKDSAFANLYESLRLNKLSNDSVNIAYTYICLGDLCADYGDMNASIQNYLIAERIALNVNDKQGIRLVYGGLGKYYFTTNHIKEALGYFLKKELIDKDAGDMRARAQTMCNIALCYEQLNDFPMASHYYHLALKETKELAMPADEALVYFNMGSMFNNRNEPDSAILYLQKALVIGREIEDLNRVASCYEFLSDAWALKKDYMKAYEFHLQFTALNDSLLNSDKIRSIADMQTKYETEKKEHRIVLLDAQNKTRSVQRNFFIVGTCLFFLLAGAIFMGLMKTAKERKRSDGLLLNILPSAVAEELKDKGSAEAKHFDEVTVMFTDFKNFTKISEKLTPSQLVAEIHTCFKAFDHIITKYNIEKIKTIGDSYMCAGGLPVPNKTNAADVVNAALEIQQFMLRHLEQRVKDGKEKFEVRIGVHTGPVVAGIVGVKKFAYDIWGDTVNIASRMESSGEAGKINISGATYKLVKDKFSCTYRGKIEAKNKGEIDMYFVEANS